MPSPKLPKDDAQLVPMAFPMNGMDVSTELGRQRPGTTPVGTNVRAMEPGLMRMRGGARPGLDKYVQERLPLPGDVYLRRDTFDRANENPIATPSDGGSNWIVVTGTPEIVSNQATAVAVGSAVLETGTADGTVRMTVASYFGAVVGFHVRYVDLSNRYFVSFGPGIPSVSTSVLTVQKVVAGVVTTLASVNLDVVLADGDVLSVRCDGEAFTFYVNGAAVFALTDSSVSGTKFGFSCFNSNVVDDFGFLLSPNHLIQHLNYIVDPTTAALLDNFDADGGDADPSSGARNPGRLIRTSSRTRRVRPRLVTQRSVLPKVKRPKKKPGKGSGRQPNRNKSGGGGAAFVQANQANIATPNSSGSLAFTSNVTKGNLLVVFGRISHNGTTTPAVVTVTDSLSNTWTQAGSYLTINTNFQGVAVFWALANASDACTVTVAHDRNPAFAGTHHIALAEYSSVRTIDSTATNVQVAPATALTTGTITVSATGELVLGAFMGGQGLVADTYSGGSGTSRLSETNSRLALYDILSQSSSTALTTTASSPASFLFDHAAFGLSFKTRSRRTARELTKEKLAQFTANLNRLNAKPNLSEDEAAYKLALQETIGGLQRELELS